MSLSDSLPIDTPHLPEETSMSDPTPLPVEEIDMPDTGVPVTTEPALADEADIAALPLDAPVGQEMILQETIALLQKKLSQAEQAYEEVQTALNSAQTREQNYSSELEDAKKVRALLEAERLTSISRSEVFEELKKSHILPHLAAMIQGDQTGPKPSSVMEDLRIFFRKFNIHLHSFPKNPVNTEIELHVDETTNLYDYESGENPFNDTVQRTRFILRALGWKINFQDKSAQGEMQEKTYIVAKARVRFLEVIEVVTPASDPEEKDDEQKPILMDETSNLEPADPVLQAAHEISVTSETVPSTADTGESSPKTVKQRKSRAPKNPLASTSQQQKDNLSSDKGRQRNKSS